MMVEVFFGAAHLFLIEETHVSDSAVSKAVDNRAAQPSGEIIIDECADIGADSGENNDQHDVHAAVSHGFPCRRRHHHF